MLLRWFYLALSTFCQALTKKRNYHDREYFVLELDSRIPPIEVWNSLEVDLEHHFPALKHYYLVSRPRQITPLGAHHGIKYIEQQVPRQRQRRGQSHARVLRSRQAPANEETYISRIEQDLSIYDPMFKDQWHLYNRIELGHDINVTGVWAQNITGRNTVVALVDDGIDMNSLDIADNYYAEGSYDFNDHNPVPSPKLSDDYHGTRCAGEIAAVKNDVCGLGIAYEAKVSGLRILSGRITDSDEALSLNYDFENNLIYSCSWGPPDDGRSMDAPGLLIQRAIINGIKNGRHGKGSIFVFASGNGAVYDDNCNFDGYTNSIFSITIGGIDRTDSHPYYSELCAPQLAVTYSSGAGGYIHTTDVGEKTCTDKHGGTSAAAPIGAGIFALVLSVRPDLTWRDLQYLCVYTAVPFALDDSDWQSTPAGFNFNHKFGFGKLDAWAIVERAKTWSNVKPQAWFILPKLQVQEELGTEPHQQVVSSVNVTSDLLHGANVERLEHITVTVNISHQRRGDVTVDLISPHGIISNLATMRRHDTSSDGFQDWTFMTVKHWGEDGLGTWQLIVGDHDNSDSTGIFHDWSMTMWGEALDVSKAAELETPGDTSSAAVNTQTSSVSHSVSAATGAATAVKPDLPATISAIHTSTRPTAVSATGQQSENTSENEDAPSAETPYNWTSTSAIVIYIGTLLVTLLLTGTVVYLVKFRTQTLNRKDYEFQELATAENDRHQDADELESAFTLHDESDNDSEDTDFAYKHRPG